MSSASAPASATEIFIADDSDSDDVEATNYTTSQWKEALGTAAADEYRSLRTRARRFIVIPFAFLAVHALMSSHNLPVWLTALAMLFVVIPLSYFRQLTKDVAAANTPAGMIERFRLYTYTPKDKVIDLPVETFKKVLGKHFTSRELKKKQRLDAAEKFLAVHTGKQKFLMWAAVIAHVFVVVLVSGPFYGLAFVLTYVLAFIAIFRYFRKATRQLRVLSRFVLSSTPADTEDASATKGKKSKDDETNEFPEDESHKDDTSEDTGPVDDDLLHLVRQYHDGQLSNFDRMMLQGMFKNGNVPTVDELTSDNKPNKGGSKPGKSHKDNAADEDEAFSATVNDAALLDMVTRHHTGEFLTKREKAYLQRTFGDTVPSTDTIKSMAAAIGSTTSEPAAADTSSTPESLTRAEELPPLPVRGSARHARPDSGPTGTPAHGTPVPANIVHFAPVPAPAAPVTDYYDPAAHSSAPAPAAADSTVVPDDVKQLLDLYYEGTFLAPDEMALIQPYLNK